MTPSPNHRHRKRAIGPVAALAVACAMTLGLGACSGGDPIADPAPTPTAEASASKPPPPPTTLLSGRLGKDHQVLIAKLDNTQFSDPHAGLHAADVVYLEEVEYGLTRYMAVFSSKYPKRIGPIRSARISDLELARQYGRVAFAFSGAQSRILDDIDRAFLYPLSNDAGVSGYSRDPAREAPWDLFGDPRALLDDAPKAIKAKDVGFTFDERPPKGGKPAQQVTVNWPSAQAQFRWSKKADRWLLWMDGVPATSTEGPQLGSTTVIVQSVDVYPSQYGDSFGGVTPITETVGRGKALLMRDGQVWPITWSRARPEDGTIWKFRGKQIPLDPGSVWIMLLDDDRRPTVAK